MASDLHKYSVQESLNLMMNSGEDALKVDLDNATITAGELDVGIAHSDDSVLVYGYDGSSNQKISTDASGNVQIDIVSGGSADAAHVDDAGFTLGTHSGMMMMGFAGTQSVDANDAGAIAMETDGSVHIHDGGNTITVDGTVTANLSATDNAVLDAMVVDLAALETLQTSTNTKLDTLETTLTAIETDQAAIETLLTAANVDHAANEVLLGTIDADTNAIKGHVDGIETLITSTNSKIDTFDAVLDNILTKNTEIDAVLDTIKTDTGTIDSDTDAIKTATESSNTHLGNMLYGTALVVDYSGGDHSLGATYEAFYIGVGGDLSLDCVNGAVNVVFKNLASGQLLPVRATVVNQSGTDATNIVALKA